MPTVGWAKGVSMLHMSPQMFGISMLGRMLPAQSWKQTQSGSASHAVS